MTDENDKELEKAEKQRLLDELAIKGSFDKSKAKTNVDNPEALSDLFRHAVGLPEDSDDSDLMEAPLNESLPMEPKKITKITHHEIRAMKSVSAKESEPVEQAKATTINFMIKGWYTFLTALSPKKFDCQANGHECIHCGAKYQGTLNRVQALNGSQKLPENTKIAAN